MGLRTIIKNKTGINLKWKKNKKYTEISAKMPSHKKVDGKDSISSNESQIVAPSDISIDVSEFVGKPLIGRKDIGRLIKAGSIGVELGVAKGLNSLRLLQNSKLAFLYSIDMWNGDRRHDVDEYRHALSILSPFKERNSCLRLTFDEALPLFEDEYFDFIYIDGYAHSGQNNGDTLEKWWPKLKPGGIFSGDDYDAYFPLTMHAVNNFAMKYNLKLYKLNIDNVADEMSSFPSWITFKPSR